MGGITHIVLFAFKGTLEAQAIEEACQRMLALQQKCLHPETNKPYIKTMTGGKDNSPEGLQRGLTHGFVVEFESEADRDYYVKKDPAHQALIKHVGPILEKSTVLDFHPGVL